MDNNGRVSTEYLAGIFDGEGCVMLNKQYTRQDGTASYTLVVQVDMVCEAIPTILHLRYGGTLKHYPAKGIRQEYWKWIAQATYALDFLRDMEPYAIVKLPQILIGIQFQEGRGGRGIYVSGEDKLVEERLRSSIRALNRG